MRFTRWDQVLSTEESNEVLFHLARKHLSQISDCKQAQDLARLLDGRDLKGLCLYDLSYGELSPYEYRNLRQVLAFFSKREDLKIGIDTKEVAYRKAIACELNCSQTNDMFRKYFQGGFMFPLDVEAQLFCAQRKISTILGPVPSLAELKLRFGPGATTQVKKKDASARRKLSTAFCSSEELGPLVGHVLAEVPVWSDMTVEDTFEVQVDDLCSEISDPDRAAEYAVQLESERVLDAAKGLRRNPLTHEVLVHPSKMGFVRKNAKTDRTINVEPMLNSFVQLGIGSWIADRLRSAGIDISDQTRNQRAAKEGSITNALATLDLSSASDNIASMLVMSLLPDEWYELLRAVRSGECGTPDGVIKQSKFSSMGNGFTFPLQTLIFFALAQACVKDEDYVKVCTYGDDIIVPSYAYSQLVKLLTCVGFEINASKSFFDGPFRESCGKDYYFGIDVRPCYIKAPLSGQTCFTLHNFYIRSGQPELADEILKYLDESLVLWGPDGYGDGHLVRDGFVRNSPKERSWGGYTFETYTYKPREAFYALGADYVYPSYSIYVKDELPDKDDLPAMRSHISLQTATAALYKVPLRALSGSFRPERSDSVYKRIPGRGWRLRDTLPGVNGYKRIKIYALG